MVARAISRLPNGHLESGIISLIDGPKRPLKTAFPVASDSIEVSNSSAWSDFNVSVASSSRRVFPPMTTLVPEKKLHPSTMTVALSLPELTHLMSKIWGASDDWIFAVSNILSSWTADSTRAERFTLHGAH